MLAYLRALCRDGLEAMRRDAQVALAGLGAASPFRANMLQVEGLSHLLEGDADRADAFFARAVDEATRFEVQPFVPLLLADRGIAAIEQRRLGGGRRVRRPGPGDRCEGGRSTTTGRAPSCMRGRPESPPNGATRRRRRRSSREPLGSGRCSPTRSPSCRPGRCWRWRGPTSRSPTAAARGPCSGRPTTSSGSGPRSATCREQADELRRQVDAIQRPGVGGFVAHRRRAPAPAAAAHPPHVPGDRRAALRLPDTRSRPRRSRSTASSASRRAARRSTASHELGLLDQR